MNHTLWKEIWNISHRLKEVKVIYSCVENPDHPELTSVVGPADDGPSGSLQEINGYVVYGFKPGDTIEVIVRKVSKDE